MARIVSGTSSMPGAEPNVDFASSEVTAMLMRLQDSLLHTTPEREHTLRTNEHERARLETNLNYARKALDSLEQRAQSSRTSATAISARGVLSAQREMLDLLVDRLEDIKEIAIEDDDDDSEGEDLLAGIIHTPSQSVGSTTDTIESRVIETPTSETMPSEPEPEPEMEIPSPPSEPAYSATPVVQPQQPYVHTTQTLRNRHETPSKTTDTASYTTARAALFAGRSKPSEPQTSTATAEAILDQQRQEQDALSDSILKMASALKASSKKFSTTLEEDKELVSKAGSSVEKTERSMESARGRMGTLRKMTEGKGWWGRVILYAWVYGLMLSLVLLVFVFPKLRF